MEKTVETMSDVEFKPTQKKMKKCVECGEVSDMGVDIQGRNGKLDFLCSKCIHDCSYEE